MSKKLFDSVTVLLAFVIFIVLVYCIICIVLLTFQLNNEGSMESYIVLQNNHVRAPPYISVINM